MVMVFAALNFHLRGRQRAARDFLRGNCPAAYRQPAQLGFDTVDFTTRIHHRTQRHIPADARKTIEVRNLHLKEKKESSLLSKPGLRKTFVETPILFGRL